MRHQLISLMGSRIIKNEASFVLKNQQRKLVLARLTISKFQSTLLPSHPCLQAYLASFNNPSKELDSVVDTSYCAGEMNEDN